MAIDDLLADRQADAGARIPSASVQALEDLENAFEILRIDADAVVLHPEDPAPLLGPGADMDLQGLLTVELQGVADEVLEELHELSGIHGEGGQRIVGHGGVRGFDAG